jgi:diguanylate cyclase (GGDEF)-like protein
MLDNSQFHIYIVDDEIFNIEVVIGFLEEERYSLHYNTNPQKALERIQEENFDLILLDINMPKLNGFDLCKQIKSDSKLKDIPIIFLSAFSDMKTITNAFELGAVDYLTKPFNGLELIARVRTHIQIRRYMKELQEKQEKLASLAATDFQTSLPNRFRFITLLKKEIIQAQLNSKKLFLAYIKLDNLAKINSMHGFSVGDQVISSFSKILTNWKKEDSTIARLFSTNFVVLITSNSLSHAQIELKQLLDEIRSSKITPVAMTCSIGLCEYQNSESYESFIGRAEAITNHIVSNGGNMISSRIS